MEPPPKTIDVELVTEDAPPPPRDEPARSGPPIHPLSAILLISVDNLWNLADWAVIDWFVTIPLSFLTVALPTFLIQRFAQRDRPGRALAFAFLLGVVAAVPTSLTGTPVGLAILAWTGLSKLMGPTLPGNRR